MWIRLDRALQLQRQRVRRLPQYNRVVSEDPQRQIFGARLLYIHSQEGLPKARLPFYPSVITVMMSSDFA